ncbi:MAG: carbohydrate-binding domain-containing protein [Prevotellamassilia sp.]|nr:carbohydrate-binding domain-containing protein [Prevotellamassilia sp.]
MKQLLLLLALAGTTLTTAAQTLRIEQGSVTTAFDASTLGESNFAAGGTTLTIGGKTYDVSTIDRMVINNTPVATATVGVEYDGATAQVEISGDLAPYLNVNVEGANVSIFANEQLQEEVTYLLSGTSNAGSFTLEGDYKATLVISGLHLTSNTVSLPPMNILNGKRIKILVSGSNSFADCAGGTHKGAFFVNGHPEIEGCGYINITGNSKHAFVSDEYTQFKHSFTGTINVLGAVGDAFHIDQYLLMQGGTFQMNNIGGDGFDISLTNDATDEHNGEVFIEGGNIQLNVATPDTKGIKSDGNMTISGGTISGTVSGNGTKGISVDGDLTIKGVSNNPLIDLKVTGTTHAAGTADESKCRGIKGKGDFLFDGGTIKISATGVKSKAISIDGTYTYKSGQMNCAVDAAN